MEHTTEDIFCSTPRFQGNKKHVNIVKSAKRWSEIYAGMGRKKFLRNEKHVLRDLLKDALRDLLKDALRDLLKDLLREITFD